METLRAASAKIDVNRKPEDVIIFEMKVTPSMKNVVYNVHLVFDSMAFLQSFACCLSCVLSHSTTD